MNQTADEGIILGGILQDEYVALAYDHRRAHKYLYRSHEMAQARLAHDKRFCHRHVARPAHYVLYVHTGLAAGIVYVLVLIVSR